MKLSGDDRQRGEVMREKTKRAELLVRTLGRPGRVVTTAPDYAAGRQSTDRAANDDRAAHQQARGATGYRARARRRGPCRRRGPRRPRGTNFGWSFWHEAARNQGLVASRHLHRSGAGVSGIGYLDRAVVNRYLSESTTILVFLAFLGVSPGRCHAPMRPRWAYAPRSLALATT